MCFKTPATDFEAILALYKKELNKITFIGAHVMTANIVANQFTL